MCVFSLSVSNVVNAETYSSLPQASFSPEKVIQSVDDVCSSTLFFTGSDAHIISAYLKLSDQKNLYDSGLGSYDLKVSDDKKRECTRRYKFYPSAETARRYDIAMYEKTDRLKRHVFIRNLFDASLSGSHGYSTITFTQKHSDQQHYPPAQISVVCKSNEGVCSVLSENGYFSYSQGTERLYELRGELSMSEVKQVFNLSEREYLHLKRPFLTANHSYSF